MSGLPGRLASHARNERIPARRRAFLKSFSGPVSWLWTLDMISDTCSGVRAGDCRTGVGVMRSALLPLWWSQTVAASRPMLDHRPLLLVKPFADLHVNYEKQPEYPLKRIESGQLDWRVQKMRLGKPREYGGNEGPSSSSARPAPGGRFLSASRRRRCPGRRWLRRRAHLS
jgi:hypothetical protein